MKQNVFKTQITPGESHLFIIQKLDKCQQADLFLIYVANIHPLNLQFTKKHSFFTRLIGATNSSF